MITVHIRKQGGAAIMTIPSSVLKTLHVDIGSTLELDATNQELVVRPVRYHRTRKRYTLSELLQGTTPRDLKTLNKKTKWARTGKSIGREQI